MYFNNCVNSNDFYNNFTKRNNIYQNFTNWNIIPDYSLDFESWLYVVEQEICIRKLVVPKRITYNPRNEPYIALQSLSAATLASSGTHLNHVEM